MQRIAYLSLGCDKNRVDTERVLGALRSVGFEPAPAPEPAFALVINTCGFIEAAKEESIEAILAAVHEKEVGHYRTIAVVGCLVERYRSELAAEIPEVDIFMGLEHVTELGRALSGMYSRLCPEGEASFAPDLPGLPAILADPFPRALTTPPHLAYLKIGDGCSSACRFCAIPRIRGPLRSEPLDRLVAEARALESAGIKELDLVAQDTTAWGRDFDPPLELSDLVEALLEKTRIPWIRLLYAHPHHVTGRLIELLAHEPRLQRYLDLPLQHISDKMLAAMGRRPDRAGLLGLLDRLSSVPDLVLRTTFLFGFPGESDDDFKEVLSLVEEGRFMWASAFGYSAEEGTPAFGLPGRVDAAEVEDRMGLFFEAQRSVTESRLAGYVGREIEVLVDGEYEAFMEGEEILTGAAGKWVGRFGGQAPEVDGVVELEGETRPGELARARVVDSFDYDLVARIVG